MPPAGHAEADLDQNTLLASASRILSRPRENTCLSADDVLNQERHQASHGQASADDPLSPLSITRPLRGRTASPTISRAAEGVPEMRQLIETARRTFEVDQKAADAGLHDNPKTISTSLDATESEVFAHFVGLARQRRDKCEASRAKVQLDLKATAAKIDVEQTKNSFARLLTAIEPGLEKLRSEHSTVLYQAKENEARALKHLRWFQQKHGLHYRAASYPES